MAEHKWNTPKTAGPPGSSAHSEVRAPRLVLLPGLDGTGTLFEPFINALGSEIATTVVRYSSPEVSLYRECRAVAERQLPRDEPFVLVGESFSGPVALSIAAAQPPGLVGVVLVGSFVSSPLQALRRFPGLIPLVPVRHRPDWLTDLLLFGRYATADLRKRFNAAMAQVSTHAIHTRLREITQVDVSRELAAVSVPLLYVRALEDRVVPPACGEEVLRLSQRARLAEAPAPHMILQCAPAECARLIVDFARDADTLN